MSVLKPPSNFEEVDEMPRKAALSLNFIIVGAGLGGLVAAITLKDAGHSVTVFDARTKEDVLSNSNGESFYVGPNIYRVLKRCGIVVPKREIWQAGLTAMRRYADGELLLNIRTETELHDECGGVEFYVANATLVKFLYKRVKEQGTEVHFQTRVAEVGTEDTSVTLANGKKLNADVVVGADGPFSVVRKAVTRERSSQSISQVKCNGEFISFRVDMQTVRDRNKLGEKLKEDEVQIWMGPGKWVCAYPLRDSEEYFIHGYALCSHPDRCPVRRREEIPATDEIRAQYSCFEPFVQDLMQIPEKVTSTHWRRSEELESWIRDDGRVVLLGDAAHPTQPTSLASTPGMNLEDGAVLGALFRRLRHASQIPLLSQTYEDLRTERCKAVLRLDGGLLQMGSLPDGPDQEMRDHMLRRDQLKFLKRQSNESLPPDDEAGMWALRVDIWKYDAWEDVEDWWLRLGRISGGGMPDQHAAPVSFRRMSIGVERQIQIASES